MKRSSFSVVEGSYFTVSFILGNVDSPRPFSGNKSVLLFLTEYEHIVVTGKCFVSREKVISLSRFSHENQSLLVFFFFMYL